MQKVWLALVVVTLAAVVAWGDVGSRQVRFVGIHPIPKSEGGGICYIEGPHVHIYAADKLQYRDHGGAAYFVGDPVAYGWDGPRYAYKGPHPIHVEAVVGGDPDVEYCYIEGPHFHYFVPGADPEFKVAGDVYYYVGEPPKVFVEARPTYAPINAVYTPLVYERPVVTVAAPIGWVGARVEFATPVVVAPAAVVTAPGIAVGVGVHIPVPSVHIGIGVAAPGVIVEERVKVKHDNGRHRGHWK